MEEKAGSVHYIIPLRIVAPPGVQVPSSFDPLNFVGTWKSGTGDLCDKKDNGTPPRNPKRAEGLSSERHNLQDEGNCSKFIFDSDEDGEVVHIPRRCRTSRDFKTRPQRSDDRFLSSENGKKPHSYPDSAGNSAKNGRKPHGYSQRSRRVADSVKISEDDFNFAGEGYKPEDSFDFAGEGPKSKPYHASSRNGFHTEENGHDYGSSPSTSSRIAVVRTVRLYNALYRHLIYEEEWAEKKPRGHKPRADLHAGTIINTKGLAVNKDQRIVGSVPGVEIGDVFCFRMEIACVGMHSPLQSGIYFLSASKSTIHDVSIATSIISSGGYDARDDGEVLIYTGQGGRTSSGGHKDDQKLVRGNLALEGNMKHSVPVRLIRGLKDASSPTGKIFVYDGLYKVESCWTETNAFGFEEFKFKLRRMPSQPALASNKFKISRALNCNPREHVRVPDISYGKETQPVCVVNSVDDENCPTGFAYMTTMESFQPSGHFGQENEGCNCVGQCKPSPTCACFRQNCHVMPYLQNGTLLKEVGLIYECGKHCRCSEHCQNRATQKPPKFHFEVFKTENRGWGLRSWDSISAGSFICEYTGIILTSDVNVLNRDYILNINALPEVKSDSWGHVSAHLESYSFQESSNTMRPKMIIDSTDCGNVARFINHSCLPNVLVQLVSRKQAGFIHVMLFAMDNILPFTELTMDYGSKAPASLRKQCLCNSAGCRGTFLS